MDLNHLNLPVRDPAACRDSYRRHFGFEPAFEAEGGYFLRDERGFLLALLPAADQKPLRPGFHLGFGVESPVPGARSVGTAVRRRRAGQAIRRTSGRTRTT